MTEKWEHENILSASGQLLCTYQPICISRSISFSLSCAPFHSLSHCLSLSLTFSHSFSLIPLLIPLSLSLSLFQSLSLSPSVYLSVSNSMSSISQILWLPLVLLLLLCLCLPPFPSLLSLCALSPSIFLTHFCPYHQLPFALTLMKNTTDIRQYLTANLQIHETSEDRTPFNIHLTCTELAPML